MVTEKLEDLGALVEAGERQKLRMLLNEEHPADIADYMEHLEPSQRLFCFRLLDLEHASAVLAELEGESQTELLRSIGDLAIVPIISRMSPDDAVDLLAELPEETASAIIDRIPDMEAKADLEQLLRFDSDTAGGIMSTDYLSLYARMTVGDALVELRAMYIDLEEDIYDIYVVDEENRLVGRVTVKELLTVDTASSVESVMEEDIAQVLTSADQEEAAEIVEHYDLLTLPVTDADGKLAGIITADDVIDVLLEEATEDIYQSSGIAPPADDAAETLGYSVRKAFSARVPWLFITLMIEAGSVAVITHFDTIIQQTVAAASFMPLLSGVTGSVATQSTCIVIRGTSSRTNLSMKLILRNIWHELKVGLLLGVCCGLFAFVVSLSIHQSRAQLGLIVSLSLIITMTVGVITGTIMPMLFQKLGFDPAHASGPFITSILDVSTMTIYLSIVHLFLKHIV